MSVIRSRTLIPLVAIVAIAVLALVAGPHPAHAAGATIYVTTIADEDTLNGSCSLREAIIAANTNADYNGCVGSGTYGVNDTINFILGAGTPVIQIGSTPLPHITQWVSIYGNTGSSDRVEIHGPGGPLASGAAGLAIDPSGFGTTISSLVINNSADDGILINADEVTLMDNFIGTDALGLAAIPNQGFGVQVLGNGNRIGPFKPSGTPCGLCGNLISGNLKANVLLDNTGAREATNSFVRGNFIGVDRTGGAPVVPNETQGVVDKGIGNTIGGLEGVTPGGSCTGDCNLISGNNINGGIVLDAAASGSIVQGNFVGTNVLGTASISNGLQAGYSEGILSYESSVVIGGTTPEARNVVSGNRGTGIQVEGVGATVEGNYLGTNSAGTAPVPNSGPGVTVYQANGAIVGGTAAGAGNLLSGSSNNGGYGVEILQSTNTQVVGNLIGTASDGTTPLPNTSDGVNVFLQSSNNIIGGAGAGAGNIIAFNGRDGVQVDGSVPQVRSNTIRGNSIYSNVDAGIALTANANDNIAAPVITNANALGASGTSCAQCYVEIFSDNHDEGRIFEGVVFTNDGNWTFSGSLTGPHITATQTDISTNTSPFSMPFNIAPPTPTPSPSPSPTPTTAPGQHKQGDLNCDDTIDARDALRPLRASAGLPMTQPVGCPLLGSGSPQFGDVRCDGTVDGDDTVAILQFVLRVAIKPPQQVGCTPIGEILP